MTEEVQLPVSEDFRSSQPSGGTPQRRKSKLCGRLLSGERGGTFAAALQLSTRSQALAM